MRENYGVELRKKVALKMINIKKNRRLLSNF